ncbi:MAG: hypothetical protein K1X50_10575 [Candidatus Promineofilum sp.]|nr:hypothetical protein [Promineifilum sp.]MCW5861890.1 hypothetical protein [Anaerolineae bacterium]
MRRSAVLLSIVALLVAALPALAQEDPLANSVLLPNIVGWGLLGLAVVLVILLRLWSSRGPQ